MSEGLLHLNNEVPASDVTKNQNQQQQLHSANEEIPSTAYQPHPKIHLESSSAIYVSPSSKTNESHKNTSSTVSKATVSTATVQSTPATVFLSSVPTATHPNNGIYPQMISTDSIYKMAPAPVFMTPSVYPQVAVVPEGDLLRSMIVQDVKQVTEKLLEKQGKKKRGRGRERNRKEKVIHGDFGTLKVNFRKFFQEAPPMTTTDLVPKRTVYQRIAPRYSVACTDVTKTFPSVLVPEVGKPNPDLKNSCSKKKSGPKKTTECKLDKKSTDMKTQRRTSRSSKAKRNSWSANAQGDKSSSGTDPVSGSDPALSQGIRASVNTTVTCLDNGIGLSASDQNETDPSAVQYSYPFTTDASELGLFSMDNCAQAITGCQSGTAADPNDISGVSLDLSRGISNGLGTSSDPALDPDGDSSNDILNEFTKSLTSLVSDSTDPRLLAGDVTTGSISQTSALVSSENVVLSNDGCISSSGQIADDFSFLSELYDTNFPALCTDDIFDKMDIVSSTEDILNNTKTHSSIPSLQASTPSQSLEITPVSTVQTMATSHAETEVVNDSSWVCTFQNNSLSTATECLQKSQDIETNNNSIQMDIDHSDSHGICESRDPCKSCDLQESCDIIVQRDTTGSHDLVDVIDISPEYASTQGGGKIILIGSWNNKTARYSCRFGDVSVEADLIQNGVLRCYCPAYKPGKVKVAVLCDDMLLSKQVDFEYVDTEEGEKSLENHNHDWLTIKEEDLKQLLIQRIEALCGILDSQINTSLLHGQTLASLGSELENNLTKICESLSTIHSVININCNNDKSMTILHLSAALGFTKLIQVLCNWTETNSNSIISQEANPRMKDQFQLTPLMWACAKGKFDTVCVLLQWDESTAQLTDGCGCTPLSISRSQGHTILERYLERSQSKGPSSKLSSMLSENGSPLLHIRGRMSRSSSMNSQFENGRESCSYTAENSPDSASGFPSRTLGQTLAYVQAIMQVAVDDEDEGSRTPLASIDVDDEGLFVPSPFTPRTQNSSCDELRHSAQTPRSSMSSLSPGSPTHGSSVQSPFDPSARDTAEFCEFFYNSDRILEKDFAELTLTDEEQQNLYRAATVIQNAYKGYRERRIQRDNELSAAVLIQSYYRRYKQYATFKKMQKGAMVIQHKYRAHREKEKQKSHAASVIQTYYRRYKERKRSPGSESFDAQQKSKAVQLADRKASRFRTQTNSRNRDSTGDPTAK